MPDRAFAYPVVLALCLVAVSRALAEEAQPAEDARDVSAERAGVTMPPGADPRRELLTASARGADAARPE